MTMGHILLYFGAACFGTGLIIGVPASLLAWKKHRNVLRNIRSSYQE